MIYINADHLADGLYNIKDGEIFKYKAKGGTVRTYGIGTIVFCKECRYCKKKRGTFKGEPIIFYRCEENNRDVENDDYCSWAEREGER